MAFADRILLVDFQARIQRVRNAKLFRRVVDYLLWSFYSWPTQPLFFWVLAYEYDVKAHGIASYLAASLSCPNELREKYCHWQQHNFQIDEKTRGCICNMASAGISETVL